MNLRLLTGEIASHCEAASIVGKPLLLPGNILSSEGREWKVLQINPACLGIDDVSRDVNMAKGLTRTQNIFDVGTGEITERSEVFSRGYRPIMIVDEKGQEKVIIFGKNKGKNSYQEVDPDQLKVLGDSMIKWDKTEPILELSKLKCESRIDLSDETRRKVELIQQATSVHYELNKIRDSITLNPAINTLLVGSAIFTLAMNDVPLNMWIPIWLVTSLSWASSAVFLNHRLTQVKEILYRNTHSLDISSLTTLQYTKK